MIIHRCEQGTDEWFAVKAGHLSAHNFHKILSPTGKPSTQAEKYLYQVAGEAVLGHQEEGYTNQWMARGLELEDEARKFYELVTGYEVEQVGFVELNDFIGCSPDGLIGEDGGLEIKCPALATHVKYLLDKKIPTEYIPQVQGNLYVTGRKWWDFLSYYPGLEPLLLRVERDEEYIGKLGKSLNMAVERLKEIIEKIRR